MSAIACMARSYKNTLRYRLQGYCSYMKKPRLGGAFSLLTSRNQPRRDSGWRSKRTPARPVACRARMLAWSVPSGVSRTAR